MSRRSRLGWLAAAIVVAVVAVIVIGSGGDSSQSPQQGGGGTNASSGSGSSGSGGGITQPQTKVVTVKDLQPVGGIQDLTVSKGDRIRFTVKSDQPEEIHMHGYDVAKDVAPGKPARFNVPATIDGVFEVELEHAGVQIVKLTVNP